MPEEKIQAKPANDTLKKVVSKIDNASNILVAVSKNPTADELAAALGLTIMLDSIGKHATAIYSGETPNIVKFLEPKKTFETNTNSLQDFIIALDKDKADHLRYKVDGNYVKVFITPYKTTLDEGDLEFSHGDYNVDLVIALGVQTLDDFDDALYEHNKIMHDAGSINITDEEPGKFAEVEWNEPGKSSVSEMVADLAYAMKDKVKVNKAVATALLTGIIAKTDRFSNDETTPKTMDIAAKLMEAGANQKQIAEKIEEAIEAEEEKAANELEVEQDDTADSSSSEKSGEALDLDKLADEASGKASDNDGELDVMNKEEESSEKTEETPVESEAPTENEISIENETPAESEAPVESAADATESTPATEAEPEKELTPEEQLDQLVNPPASSALDELQKSANEIYPNPQDDVDGTNKGDVIEEPEVKPKDYGQMMEEALAEPLPNPAAQMTPAAPTGPELNHIPDMDYVPHAQTTPVTVPQMGEEFLTAGAPAPAAPDATMGAAPDVPMGAEPVPAPAAMPDMGVAPVPPVGMPATPEASVMPEAAVPTVPGEPTMAPVQGMSEPIAQPVVNPVMPEMPVAPAPEMPAPSEPMMPAADAASQFTAEPTPMMTSAADMGMPAADAAMPAMPEMPAPEMPTAPAPASDMTASQLEQANDPGAFKIPGM